MFIIINLQSAKMSTLTEATISDVLAIVDLSFSRIVYQQFFFLNNLVLLTETSFSLNITHSSINFTWFVLVSHQKFNDRPLFVLGALCLICQHFE